MKNRNIGNTKESISKKKLLQSHLGWVFVALSFVFTEIITRLANQGIYAQPRIIQVGLLFGVILFAIFSMAYSAKNVNGKTIAGYIQVFMAILAALYAVVSCGLMLMFGPGSITL